jgi:transposase
MLLNNYVMSKTEQKSVKKQRQNVADFKLVDPYSAGIDIGDTLHVVAVPPGSDTDGNDVRQFGTFTCDLVAIAEWLKDCKVRTVAMESTGIYWKPLYALLVSHGFEVYLVNARHTRNITGKKTDESDARWIQKLHSYGLLSTSFLPDELTGQLRTLTRHRRKQTRDRSTCVQRMQKALEQMNLKIHTVIADLMGRTGTAIIEAILSGERDAESFLALVDGRVKAKRSDILRSLEGNWQREQLFLLEQHYQHYCFLQMQIQSCDKQIEQLLQVIHAQVNEGIAQPLPIIRLTPTGRISRQNKTKNQPLLDTRGYLKGIHQVDVMDIYGLDEICALEILSETGFHLHSKWETSARFISWLNLCPNNKITGGKLISSRLLSKKANPAAQAFRMAANGVRRSNNWLGHFFRRMKTKGGHKYAIVATARKIALIYYKMVTSKQTFNPANYDEYIAKHQKARIEYLQKALDKLQRQVA